MASIHNPSDATPELVDFIAERFDDWPQATKIDTSTSIIESRAAAIAAVLTHARMATVIHRFEVDVTQLRNELLLGQGLPGPAKS
jgi:hypothetical protein